MIDRVCVGPDDLDTLDSTVPVPVLMSPPTEKRLLASSLVSFNYDVICLLLP